jgi:hypothetical protein
VAGRPGANPNNAHAFKCQSRQNLCAHNVPAPYRAYHALTLPYSAVGALLDMISHRPLGQAEPSLCAVLLTPAERAYELLCSRWLCRGQPTVIGHVTGRAV